MLRAEGLRVRTRTTTTVTVVDEQDESLIHIMEFGQDGLPDVYVGDKAGAVTCHWQGRTPLDLDHDTDWSLNYQEPGSLEDLHFLVAAMLSMGLEG